MKKYLIIFYLLIACFVVSCDDYLKTESNSTFTEENLFTNLDFAKKAVNGTYRHLTNIYTYTMIFFRMDADIEFAPFKDDGGFKTISHYGATDGISTLGSVWKTLYQGIEQANICIEGIPKSPIWNGDYAKEARQLYGEAVTMRAYFYFELMSYWGDVPFKLKSTQADDDFFLPKTDRDEIYEYLIQDLKDVEDDMLWMDEMRTTERVNKAFTKGLRARMALAYAGYSLRNKTFETRRGRKWQEYYEIARQECKEIMESGKHQLNPSFVNIFKTIQAYSMDLSSKEVLYELPFGRLDNGRVSESIGMVHTTADKKYGRAASQVYVPPTYYYSFDKKDIRRNVSVELYSYSSSSTPGIQVLASATGMGPCKWRRSWINPGMGGDLYAVTYTGVNWPMMRYADIVLMRAEAENEINGPTQIAKDALALVRKRAFPENLWPSKVTHYVDSVSVSKEAFFNAIVDERAWEFGGELLRKQDLVRWNLLGPKIRQMKEESQKLINNDPKYANVPDYIFWKRNADGETIDILNPDYRLPGTAITGYTRASHWPLMSVGSKTSFTTTMGYVANGYNEAKNNHLYPISADIITTSNGILSNDQIP
ncbi:MAG: hypothetical protein A2W90_04630 [Bacteroidetes bacterium GWF2_42_66]|nr:MAG: hypothetical protein A2W92_10770 [Bacteroidetes bacterium GWA2_42_15]OFY00753.1 MAG: hypothetical protein A2W89_20850 [Bacteroidetes bacterium GWE2_42_39]OFY40778.1 MAG: hypothetical protein A2W90_04630 [Bacteroidetes bacterium GWF2_42_66]HBL75791.1 hypothetical protein [Prolixibacteraceae bacterium]HCR91597.1 hypothetical protein [Prolixibacteraceae bacterium]